MIYTAGTTLYAAPDDEQAQTDARAYVLFNNLNADSAKIVRREGMIMVIAKTDVEIA